MKKTAFTLLIIVSIILAAQKRYTREYTYYASDYDSKVTARTNALEQVKILLLEELSKFIQSNEKLTYEDGKEVYKEDINTYVAGIAKTQIVDEKWNGTTYWVKADIVVDPDDVIKKLKDVVNNKELSSQLKSEQQRATQLKAENEKLRKQLETLKKSTAANQELQRRKLTQAYTESSKKIASTNAASDWFNKGYYASSKQKKVEYYTKAITLDPNYKSALYNRGIAHYDQQQYYKAISDYTKAINLDYNYTSAWYNRSLCYYNLAQYPKALTDVNRALVLDTKFANAYLNRANIYYVQKKYYKAITDYNKSLSLNSNSKEPAFLYLAKSYKKTKQYQNAITYYNKALKKVSHKEVTWFERGYCYGELGQKGKAISDYTKALQLNPQHTSSLYNRGTVYYGQGYYNKAITDFKTLLRYDPNYSFGYYYLGLIYQNQGQYNRAITEYNNYIGNEKRSSSRSWVTKAQNAVRSLGGTPANAKIY